jgi:hypothetical protein
MSEKTKSYKGFHMDMTCNGFQFEIGRSYKHGGNVKCCSTGFHSCEYPLDVFEYYDPSDSRYAIVSTEGKTDRDGSDTKFAAAKITIEAELKIPEMVQHAVGWIMAQLIPNREQTVIPGDRSAATNTGYRSAATNTGDRSAATNTGHQSAATNTGYQSAATNTGYQSAATNTGDRSAATNTGYRSAATNTGYQSAATNTGDRSAATNTGHQSAATVEGRDSVAISSGPAGKAKACKDSAIVLCYRDDVGHLIHIRASKVGDNGIKPDTWYSLNDDAEFIEITE